MKKKKIVPVLFPGTEVNVSAIQYTDSDPLGSYTGRPKDPLDTPVQDADDL